MLPRFLNMSPRNRLLVPSLLTVAVALTILVYWPGLSGGYVFDDFPNIVDNNAIHVTHSTLANWTNAALASPASALHRPLASLTFAVNWFFSGDSPRPMKAMNLGIHLLNGVLLYFMLSELLRVWRAALGEGAIDEDVVKRLALVVSAGWLLLPINLMAVLYVVQRMESLCQIFVLAGLWAYLHGRWRMLTAVSTSDGRTGLAIAAAGLVLGTGIGLLSKESSVLLPVYAFLAECVLLRFRSRKGEFALQPNEKGRYYDRRILCLFVYTLLLPAILGLAWLLPYSLNTAAWDGRSFTLGERLLTEARVLVKYLDWTVLPDPDTLSLYHDEIVISKTLSSPWTTLPAILFLTALVAVAAWLRNRKPLAALGILWFFAGHLLTATIIPLELVYEHRNYFASIGVLLALFSLLLGLRREILLPVLRGTITVLLLMWFAGATYLRAQDWSNPLRLALAEANRHPNSPRANYEAGRLLIIASHYELGEALEKSKFYLRRAAAIPTASTLPEQAQIMIADHTAHGDDAQLWRDMERKLRNQPTTEEDISALISLTRCKVKNDCHFEVAPLQRAFLAALSRLNPMARLLAAYSNFARDLLHDDSVAIRYMQLAVKKDPNQPAYRMQLAQMLAVTGQTQEAVRQIDALRHMDSFGRLDTQIRALEQQAKRNTLAPVH